MIRNFEFRDHTSENKVLLEIDADERLTFLSLCDLLVSKLQSVVGPRALSIGVLSPRTLVVLDRDNATEIGILRSRKSANLTQG